MNLDQLMALSRAEQMDWLMSQSPDVLAPLRIELADKAALMPRHSKETKNAWLELTRRCEYALVAAVRRGQAEGWINTRRYQPKGAVSPRVYLPRPKNYDTDIQHLHNGVSLEEFEATLEWGRRTSNLTRNALIARLRRYGDETPKVSQLTTPQKLARIAELASTGMAVEQIATSLGMTAERVRHLALHNNITITPGVGRVKLDQDHIVNHLAISLEGLVEGLDRLDTEALDAAQVQHWAASLSTSTTKLHRFVRRIKETVT